MDIFTTMQKDAQTMQRTAQDGKFVVRDILDRKMSRLDYYIQQCCNHPCKRKREESSPSVNKRQRMRKKCTASPVGKKPDVPRILVSLHDIAHIPALHETYNIPFKPHDYSNHSKQVESQVVPCEEEKMIIEETPKMASNLRTESPPCSKTGFYGSTFNHHQNNPSLHDTGPMVSTLTCALECLENNLKDQSVENSPQCSCNSGAIDLSKPRNFVQEEVDPAQISGSPNLDLKDEHIAVVHPMPPECSFYSDVIDLSKSRQEQRESSIPIEPELDVVLEPEDEESNQVDIKVPISLSPKLEPKTPEPPTPLLWKPRSVEIQKPKVEVAPLNKTSGKLLKCSLKKCLQGELKASHARVEVKAFVLKENEKAHYLHCEVAWGQDGQAMFHDVCWKDMLESHKTDIPFKLCPKEKEMLLDARKTAEYFDSLEKVEHDARRIAQMLRSSEYAIAFTGAGISTSAGIGDYRGKSGKWTEQDRKKKHGIGRTRHSRHILHLESMRPVYTHEAIAKLVEMGILKHVLSQNVDGLHRLSGIPRDRISELHGNSFHERCERCRARYERPYPVRRRPDVAVPAATCTRCGMDHRTGRKCDRENCSGYLRNTIINFGDKLEKPVLTTAQEHARKNDLVLCLGSSLCVTPACELVEMGKKPTRLVICNRQSTPFEAVCHRDYNGARVFGDVDVLMRRVMRELLPPEELRAWEAGLDSRGRSYDEQRVPERDEEDDEGGIIEGI